MSQVHPSAIVSPDATLGDDITIGPYCVVGANVSLGHRVVLHSHVAVDGRTTIGAGTQVFPFASLGHPPQDLKFSGEPSELIIGSGNMIREHVTMNPGTKGGAMLTRVGDDGLYMMGAHVAHDCFVGDRVIMANNATLAGHVTIDDDAIIGGLSAIHQFVRIGRRAMIGGMSGVEHDVIPYGLVMGERASLHGLNLVGLKRSGAVKDEIKALRDLYDTLFLGDGTLAERMTALESGFDATGPAAHVLEFLRGEAQRALCKPKQDDGP